MPEEMKELKSLIEDQGRAWEEFKSTNDARLKAIEEKGYAPADLEEKVATINTDLSRIQGDMKELAKKANRPAVAGQGELTEEQIEHKQKLSAYMRKGEEAGLHELERKAMNRASDPDGGYLVTSEMDADIDRVAGTIATLRGLATVRTIGGRGYKKLVKTRGVSGGWLGEQDDSSETNAPQYAEIEIIAHKEYAEPWVSNEMLEDAEYDLEADLASESGITFSELEGAGFITGTGVKQPRGILSYGSVVNSSYAWGSIGHVVSGAAGAFAASNPGDSFIDLQHALKQQYRNGAYWLMNDATLSQVRQIKDGAGNFYLWNPDPGAGFGGALLGAPVSVDDNMPDMAANSLSIAFGNFRRGYTVVDRRGIAVIRDNVTKKGVTKFHLSKRVGGDVTNFEAIKVMKFSA